MDLRATPNLVHLSESGRRSLQLEVAKGFRVVAVSGDVWVTQAGFIEDYILRPGGEVTLESRGPAVVTSFGPADIELIAPTPAAVFEPPQSISAEAIERAKYEAHRLRAQAMQDIFGAATAWAGSLGRRLVSAVTAGVAGGTRRHC